MRSLNHRQWIAVTICIAVPVFLMYQNNESGIFGTAIISYVVMAVAEEWKKIKVTAFAPVVGYIAIIMYGAVKITLTDESFYKERIDILVNIVKYGAILLLAIPFFYYNKEDE